MQWERKQQEEKVRTGPWRVPAVDLQGRHLQLLSFHCPGLSWEWVYCLLLLPPDLSKCLLWVCLAHPGRKQTNFPLMENSENSFVCFRGKAHKCCCDVTVLTLLSRGYAELHWSSVQAGLAGCIPDGTLLPGSVLLKSKSGQRLSFHDILLVVH